MEVRTAFGEESRNGTLVFASLIATVTSDNITHLMQNERPRKQKFQLDHSQFFALRTPLLPMEELVDWSASLAGAQAAEAGASQEILETAWKHDVQVLRNRLRKIIERSEILHALYVASPSLQSGIEHWKRDPDSKKGLQAERALSRYFARMSARCTPFGLFSGLSLGRLAESDDDSVLTLKPRSQYRLYCRLDFDYLFALTAALRRDPALEMELRYWPNSSLHRIADAWHYTESRFTEGKRSHHLVKVESDPYLEAVLRRAEAGATIPELVEAVVRQPGDANPSEDDAREYVLGLIRENDVLISSLFPLLTGIPPLDDISRQIEALPSGASVARSLHSVRERIAALEHKGLDCTPADYESVTTEVEKLPAKHDRVRLYQVDMIKPVVAAALGKTVVAELVKGVRILCRLGETGEPGEIKLFRAAYLERYENAKVPLMEVLDEEAGIGFGTNAGAGAGASPLLRGLTLKNKVPERPWETGPLDSHEMLLRKAFECAQSGQTELELDVSSLRLEAVDPQWLPDAFSVIATIAASSAHAVQNGDFEIYMHSGIGPSGVRLLGRFCHADPEIMDQVRSHLRHEEALDPNAVFAEVVYLPEGRVGNILSRPVLRDYEIPYLGRSGVQQDRQLPVSDLLVGVEQGNVVLYSRRLGRRVIPRMTNAHSFMDPQLSSVYRFLCSLQHQRGVGLPDFSWGPLESLDFLPRVRAGRLVLSLARWKLSQEEITAVGKLEGARRFLAVQELRRRRALPRWVVLREEDNFLPVDLDNALSVDGFVHALQRGTQATLAELYPSIDRLCATGHEGRFHHELNVPFVRVAPARAPDEADDEETCRMALTTAHVPREARILAPGSEWLYFKLYGGAAILDGILTAVVLPLARAACASGAAVRWFFVRYSDPHEHLRIRFHGAPGRLSRELLPLAFQAFNALLASGKLWRVSLDTYQREIERYGGVEGVLAAEDIFFADSEAVLDILRSLGGDEGMDMRWRIGLMGIDRLFSDLGLDEETRLANVDRWRDALQSEFKIDAQVRRRLGEKFRAERPRLENLLEPRSGSDGSWDFAQAAFASRSSRMADAVERLRSAAAHGTLTVGLSDLAISYVHMHINRLIRSSQRTHELVLFDFLSELYHGRRARKVHAQSRSAYR